MYGCPVLAWNFPLRGRAPSLLFSSQVDRIAQRSRRLGPVLSRCPVISCSQYPETRRHYQHRFHVRGLNRCAGTEKGQGSGPEARRTPTRGTDRPSRHFPSPNRLASNLSSASPQHCISSSLYQISHRPTVIGEPAALAQRSGRKNHGGQPRHVMRRDDGIQRRTKAARRRGHEIATLAMD